MNRGRGRQAIFHGDAYHLLVKTPRANLSRAMRHINGLYTQRHNRRAGTDGSLFRGRFKAIVVEANSYLLQLSRYIHRNPVEMQSPLVDQLEDYPWSSYPAYLNQAKVPGWLYREQTYGTLGHRNRYAQYKAYTEQGNSQQIRHFYDQAHLSPVLGSDTFKEEVTGRDWKNVEPEKLRQQLYEPVPVEHILAQVSHQFETDESQLLKGKQGRRNEARWIAMYLCQRLGYLPLSDIAAVFGLSSISGVSHSLSRLAQETSANPALDRQLQLLIHDLAP